MPKSESSSSFPWDPCLPGSDVRGMRAAEGGPDGEGRLVAKKSLTAEEHFDEHLTSDGIFYFSKTFSDV